MAKLIIIGIALFIAFNLFRALFFVVTNKPRDKKQVVRSLTWRIGLSSLLFLLLFVMNHFGFIQLHGLPQKPQAELSQTK